MKRRGHQRGGKGSRLDFASDSPPDDAQDSRAIARSAQQSSRKHVGRQEEKQPPAGEDKEDPSGGAHTQPSSLRARISRTAPGSAFPPVRFITWHMRKFSTFFSPAR